MGCCHCTHYQGTLFRGSNYHKSVCLGRRRVKDGECCAIWTYGGRRAIVKGPERVWVMLSEVRFMDRYIADQNQYLVVKYRDGRKEHIRGPNALFLDPVVHESIVVQQSISLNAFEAIVVYRESGGTSNPKTGVDRRIARGPALFIPEANEWIHEFQWHGADPNDKTHQVKGANKFQKLCTLPDQIYYNVRDVRTSDDAQLCVKLMIFYHLQDIEQMLDSTQDPIGDFVNAVCADVINFAAVNTFETFLQHTASLSELTTFPVLMERASRTGYLISKVVFRGYKASDQLQATHDTSIQARTKLRLEMENMEQNQILEDLKIQKSLERSQKEREMNAANLKHKMEMEKLECESKLKQKQEQAQVDLLIMQQRNEAELQFLNSLRSQGVDLTKYLVSKEQKAERVVRVETDGQNHGSNIHINA